MSLYILRIEIDGHFHGSSTVPKPWVARITGTCSRYGLSREFIEKMPDYRDYRRSWRGNTYGLVHAYPMREGLHEVSRLRGNSSKRHVAREFVWCDGSRLHRREPLEALALAEDDARGDAAIWRVTDDADDRPWAAEVTGLGVPRQLGWVVVGRERWYRLREGRVYETREIVRARRGSDTEHRRLVTVREGAIVRLSHEQAIALVQGAA